MLRLRGLRHARFLPREALNLRKYSAYIIWERLVTALNMNAFWGIAIPFIGTSAGAACVFFMRKSMGDSVQRALTGFAAGVTIAVIRLESADSCPRAILLLGKMVLCPGSDRFLDRHAVPPAARPSDPHLHRFSEKAEGPKSRLHKTTMLVLAVTLHNTPEGMAVGVVYAGFLTGSTGITAAGALALSIGIAIQNFPEGLAIVSMPLRAEGEHKAKAFAGGVLSGIVEPIGAVLTILAASFIVPALPFLLSFAAGAMIYVVVEELIPEMSAGNHSNIGTVFFAAGFTVMMILDVALG